MTPATDNFFLGAIWRRPGFSPLTGTTADDAMRKYIGSLFIALAALAVAASGLSPDAGGPGITCDESYHVLQGKVARHCVARAGVGLFPAQ